MGGGDVSECRAAGFLLGQDEESVLGRRFCADLGGVEAVSVGDQVGLLPRRAPGQRPVQRRPGIVEASAAPSALLHPIGLRSGEVAEAVADQLPHPVEHGAFLGGAS